jgi:carbon storage regulator
MLILGRRTDEKIIIGDDIVVTVVECKKGHCRLGVTAPAHVSMHRQEVYDATPRGRTNAESCGMNDERASE